ncbi:hypothetical protein GY45DRAFT_1325791 [Cubamyces sp. BRFM 1775]|nr:hypothetical protein GY45DRAFT_1325791 [Cubamyces sp. BRFM 1775]
MSGMNDNNSSYGPVCPAPSHIIRSAGVPVEVPKATPPRHGNRALVINFAKPERKPILWVYDMLHIHRPVQLRAMMGTCNTWNYVVRIYSFTGIRLQISWPGYETYTERIPIGRTEQDPFELLVAVAEAYERFFGKIMRGKTPCSIEEWAIPPNARVLNTGTLEIVNLVHLDGDRFAATTFVHDRRNWD